MLDEDVDGRKLYVVWKPELKMGVVVLADTVGKEYIVLDIEPIEVEWLSRLEKIDNLVAEKKVVLIEGTDVEKLIKYDYGSRINEHGHYITSSQYMDFWNFWNKSSNFFIKTGLSGRDIWKIWRGMMRLFRLIGDSYLYWEAISFGVDWYSILLWKNFGMPKKEKAIFGRYAGCKCCPTNRM